MTLSHAVAFPKPSKNHFDWIRLVTGTAGLGDDALEFVDLLLGTDEGTELRNRSQQDDLVAAAVERLVMHTLFLASLRARLSLELRSNSITRFS